VPARQLLERGGGKENVVSTKGGGGNFDCGALPYSMSVVIQKKDGGEMP